MSGNFSEIEPRLGLRAKVAKSLDPDLYGRLGLSVCNQIVAWVILISALIAILETESAVYDSYVQLFTAFELLVLVFFTIEYATRIWVSIENSRYPSRWSYLITPVAILDLFVLITMVFTFVGVEAAFLRLFRLLRLLRVAKLVRFSRAVRNIAKAFARKRDELIVSVLIALTLLVVSASVLYLVEGGTQPDVFGSIPRAMWWAVATLTTVGYGDALPVTPLGKCMAAVTAIAGVGLVAMPAGILASAFNDALRKKED